MRLSFMTFCRCFLREERAVAATEFALVFPVAVTMFLGTIDLGNGLLLARKLLAATQTTADLLTREEYTDRAIFDATMEMGHFIIQPFDLEPLGYDVASLRFEGSNATPMTGWRETFNMAPDARLPGLADGLGRTGEGVIVVVMTYQYRPAFFRFVVGEIELRETALLRGRLSPFVPWGESS